MTNNFSGQILVLDDDGANLGQMFYKDAQKLAVSRSLDLVQVNKSNDRPVYKIMDHGKWKYAKKKKDHKSQIHQLKEVNFTVNIDPHDSAIKVKKIEQFLQKHSDVKISVNMKGRQRTNPELAKAKLNEILNILGHEDIQIQQRRNSAHSITVTIRTTQGN